ncbi:MAG: hypothetical protein ABI759_08810 [Candidatus Solibacter sp.]
MNSSPSPDPLVALWRTAPKPDTQHLLQDLHRLRRMHQRLERMVVAMLCAVSVLLILAEATGRIATHGILSVIWMLGLAIGVARQKFARHDRIDALALDTVSLLKYMLARAKSDLFIARCLYAGVPCGALVGTLAAKIIGIGASRAAIAAHPQLQPILTYAGLAVLIIMVVTGVILARSRRLQVKALTEKLRSVEAGQ